MNIFSIVILTIIACSFINTVGLFFLENKSEEAYYELSGGPILWIIQLVLFLIHLALPKKYNEAFYRRFLETQERCQTWNKRRKEKRIKKFSNKKLEKIIDKFIGTLTKSDLEDFYIKGKNYLCDFSIFDDMGNRLSFKNTYYSNLWTTIISQRREDIEDIIISKYMTPLSKKDKEEFIRHWYDIEERAIIMSPDFMIYRFKKEYK